VRLEDWNTARRKVAGWYDRAFSPLGGITPVSVDAPEDAVYHLYVVRVADRDGLRAYLQSRGIASGLHYPEPIHLQPAYRCLGYGKGAFPQAEAWARELVSLAIHPYVTQEQADLVISAVQEWLQRQ